MAIDERSNVFYIAKDHSDAEFEAGLRATDVPEVVARARRRLARPD